MNRQAPLIWPFNSISSFDQAAWGLCFLLEYHTVTEIRCSSVCRRCWSGGDLRSQAPVSLNLGDQAHSSILSSAQKYLFSWVPLVTIPILLSILPVAIHSPLRGGWPPRSTEFQNVLWTPLPTWTSNQLMEKSLFESRQSLVTFLVKKELRGKGKKEKRKRKEKAQIEFFEVIPLNKVIHWFSHLINVYWLPAIYQAFFWAIVISTVIISLMSYISPDCIVNFLGSNTLFIVFISIVSIAWINEREEIVNERLKGRFDPVIVIIKWKQRIAIALNHIRVKQVLNV